MRDPKRIPPIMQELMALWMIAPDLRLGQLIENIHSETKQRGNRADLFMTEDDVLRRGMADFMVRLASQPPRPDSEWSQKALLNRLKEQGKKRRDD